MQNEQTAEGILALLNLTHALTGVGGSAVTLIVLGIIGKYLLGKAREGMATSKQFEDLESYVRRIDKKEQKTRGAALKIAGHIDIDLPELND